MESTSPRVTIRPMAGSFMAKASVPSQAQVVAKSIAPLDVMQAVPLGRSIRRRVLPYAL